MLGLLLLLLFFCSPRNTPDTIRPSMVATFILGCAPLRPTSTSPAPPNAGYPKSKAKTTLNQLQLYHRLGLYLAYTILRPIITTPALEASRVIHPLLFIRRLWVPYPILLHSQQPSLPGTTESSNYFGLGEAKCERGLSAWISSSIT